jgi:hypothetical protein
LRCEDCWATIHIKSLKTAQNTANTRQGWLLGNMADIVNELDMEFTKNVGEIITSNAEE